MSRLLLVLLLSQAAQTSPSPQTPTNQTPAPTAPAAGPAASDPAAVTFSTAAGLLFVAVHREKAADYDAVIVALQDALSRSEEAAIRSMASGWRVFKAAETDGKSNAIYVHLLLPAVPGVDYRPSVWLDRLLQGAPPELLARYREAFAGAPSKLALVEFANMTVAPVPPANATPAAPTPPAAPANAPAKPGNGSPDAPAADPQNARLPPM